MGRYVYRFCELDGLIAEVHELFQRWEASAVLTPPLDADGFERLKLAVHEWLANLVQHAQFVDRTPEVSVVVETQEEAVRCFIEDNSDGFDLPGHLDADRNRIVQAMPDRGMGLLLLTMSADQFGYRPTESGRQCLELVVHREPSADR